MNSIGKLQFRFAVLAMFTATRLAAGACPNPCELTVEPAVVEPAMPCATITASKQTCDCALLLDAVNECGSAIEALDFEFGLCWSSASAQQSCTVLEPGYRGSLFLKLEAVGSKTWSFHLNDADDVGHELQLAANVSSIGSDGCGCVVARRDGTAFGVAALGLLALIAVRNRRPRC